MNTLNNEQNINVLIKAATHYYLNKYQENDNIYGDFVSALEKIIFKYQPKFPFKPYHLFEIHFLPDDVAILWVNTCDDENAYKEFTDMKVLTKEVAELVTYKPADFSSYTIIDDSTRNQFEKYDLSKNICIAAEDFDLLVNDHYPEIYKDESINAELMNKFLNCLCDSLYETK